MRGPRLRGRRQSRALWGAVLLALLVPAGTGAAAQSQSGFCKDFRFIYDQRFEGFRKLRGFREDSTTFLPLVTPPNAQYCKISISEVSSRADYLCAWRYTDQAQAVEDAQALVKSIKACLGGSAATSPGYVGDPPPLFQDTVWDSKSRSGTQVRVTEAGAGSAARRTVLFMRIEFRG